MTDAQLIAAWRERAAYFRRVLGSAGVSKCNEPNRALRRGMAAMADMCADELEQHLKRAANHAKPR
jgi:hypothetical protein